MEREDAGKGKSTEEYLYINMGSHRDQNIPNTLAGRRNIPQLFSDIIKTSTRDSTQSFLPDMTLIPSLPTLLHELRLRSTFLVYNFLTFFLMG
ncbi:hypothetical protein V6N11_059826 [Hibiscus sabdariffa]|uniref:Uncharacterized protein n=1 Tax=Hibiscus sabdariffa TaxID=183260 RepID=A0ABR2NYC5_9ROSI